MPPQRLRLGPRSRQARPLRLCNIRKGQITLKGHTIAFHRTGTEKFLVKIGEVFGVPNVSFPLTLVGQLLGQTQHCRVNFELQTDFWFFQIPARRRLITGRLHVHIILGSHKKFAALIQIPITTNEILLKEESEATKRHGESSKCKIER